MGDVPFPSITVCVALETSCVHVLLAEKEHVCVYVCV